MNNTVAYKDLCAGSVIRKPSREMGLTQPVVVLSSCYTTSTHLVGTFVDAEEHVALTVRDKQGVTSKHRVCPDLQVDLLAPFSVPQQTSIELGPPDPTKALLQKILESLDGALGAEIAKDIIRKELADGG